MTHLRKASRGAQAVALLISLAVAGCSSSSSGGGEGAGGTEGECKAGLNAPFATPAGTPFTLPAGITQEGEMTGDVDVKCANESFLEYGSDLISICLGLRNTTNADVTVTFPAGLVFISKDPASQNGIILQSHDVVVPAGRVAYFYFRPFCLNKHCIYGRKEDRYTFGNVASAPKLRELVTIASKKKIDGGMSSYVFGLLVWDITDGEGMTDEHLALLADVPDA